MISAPALHVLIGSRTAVPRPTLRGLVNKLGKRIRTGLRSRCQYCTKFAAPGAGLVSRRIYK